MKFFGNGPLFLFILINLGLAKSWAQDGLDVFAEEEQVEFEGFEEQSTDVSFDVEDEEDEDEDEFSFDSEGNEGDIDFENVDSTDFENFNDVEFSDEELSFENFEGEATQRESGESDLEPIGTEESEREFVEEP